MTRRKRSIKRFSSSESESVSEDSEFVPSCDDESEDDDDVSEASEKENGDSEEDSTVAGGFRPKKIQVPVTPSARRGKSKNTIAYSDFVRSSTLYSSVLSVCSNMLEIFFIHFHCKLCYFTIPLKLPKTDEYFEKQSEKILTSDRTLARLKNPRLNEEKLQELLSTQSHISTTHTRAICRITEDHKTLFPTWYHILE